MSPAATGAENLKSSYQNFTYIRKKKELLVKLLLK
jgi:hypothetical protein